MLAGLFVYATLFVGLRSRPMDFEVYYRAAERLRAGGDLYRSGTEGAFSYPPFAAWPCVSLTLVSLRTAQWLWAVLQGLSLVLVLHFAARLSRCAWKPLTPLQRRWCFAAVALMSVRHLNAPLESSQTDLMITAMCLGGVLWLQEDRTRPWAGVPIAAAVGMKAAPLLFLLFLSRWKQWRAVLVLVVAVVALNVFPSIQFPSVTGRLHALQWLDIMARPAVQAGPAADRMGVWRADEEYNQSLGGLLSRLFIKGCYSADALLVRLEPRSMKMIFVVSVLGLMACAMFVRRGRWYGLSAPPLTPTGYDAAVVMALILLFSPKTSKAHYCSMLLPILLLTARAVRTPKHWASILWFIVAIAIGLLTKGVVGSKPCNILMDYGYLVWFALFALTYLLFQRAPEESTTPTR